MAASKKTQQSSGSAKTDHSPDPEAIARHFMTLWQQQWQDYLQSSPGVPADMQAFWTQAMGAMGKPVNPPASPFGFTGNFGQTKSHDTTAAIADATELAAAALAASGQCLELLKQFSERLDDVAKRVDTITKPKPATKPTTKPKKRT